MAEKYPSTTYSSTSTSPKAPELCRAYEQNPASCASRSCQSLHVCRTYLLKGNCPEFESNGKCRYAHSFYTRHNKTVLEQRFRLFLTDEKLFEKIMDKYRASAHANGNQKDKKSSEAFPQKMFNQLQRFMAGSQRPVEANHLALVGDSFVSKPAHRPLTQTKSAASASGSKPMLINSDYGSDHGGLGWPKTSAAGLLTTYHSHSVKPPSAAAATTDAHSSHSEGALSLPGRHVISRFFGHRDRSKGNHPHAPNSHRSKSNGEPLRNVFEQYRDAQQLAYLHGPVKQHLIEAGDFPIHVSGYCRIDSVDKEDRLLYAIDRLLPKRLKTDWVRFNNDFLAVISCTAAAERLFEQNIDQLDYAVISEPSTVSLHIEVIEPPGGAGQSFKSNAQPQAHLLPTTHNPNSASAMSFNDRLTITSTNSSLSLQYGDITRTQADMMVCVTTSASLLESVLDAAGRQTKSQYYTKHTDRNPFVLAGGNTAARDILFIRWMLEIRSSDMLKAQRSLAALVKDSIREAHRTNARSITFPSVGTGGMGLDSKQAAEVMINTAIECLRQHTMDITFVLYASTASKENDPAYQAFRSHLSCFGSDGKPKRALTATASATGHLLLIPVSSSRNNQQIYPCRRIGIVSDAKDQSNYQARILQSLQGLFVQKIYDMSLVHSSFTANPQALINLCVQYHVIPTLNFAENKLTLRSTRESCSQCFANLRQPEGVYKHYISTKSKAKNNEEIKLNTYVSLKIEETIANGESTIRIQDDQTTNYRVNLTEGQVYVNENSSGSSLGRMEISDNKHASSKPNHFPVPSIRVVNITLSAACAFECFKEFIALMSSSNWRVERVDPIDNWPLSVYYARKKGADETMFFHSCASSSVQSIIHYGLHSTSGSVRLARDPMVCHRRDSHRSTDGTYSMFAVMVSKRVGQKDSIELLNDEAHYALPTHLIIYRQRQQSP